MNRHISEQYDTELETVRRHLMEMGGLVEKQVRDASLAFVTHDDELAQTVRDGDREVNQMELTIDSQCINILARRQPAATDLRLLVTIMKSSTDLERVGDEACRVAKMAQAVMRLDPPGDRYQAIRDMSAKVARMVSGALDALARLDVDAALEQISLDDEVDDAYDAISRDVDAAVGEAAEAVQRGMRVLWTARSLERIGDHAKNICQYVVFLVRGEDVRHPSVSEHVTGA